MGKIPRDMYEVELVPVFETVGRIYEFRLMLEFSGENRGYAFVMYTSRSEAGSCGSKVSESINTETLKGYQH